MTPVSYENDGIQITVTNVTKNKVFPCNRCASYEVERCAIKKRLSISFNEKELIATEIIVVVANVSGRPINVTSKGWEIVDSEGFSYGCFAPCDSHIATRMINPDQWEITPGTQVKFALLFPELEEKINVVSLLFNGRGLNARLDIRKPTKKVEALLLARENYEKLHRPTLKNNI